MPIYEYRCGACARRFEALLERRDETAPECPKCGALQSERTLSAFAVSGRGHQAPPEVCGAVD